MYTNRKGIQFSKRDSYDSCILSKIIVNWLKNFQKHYTNCSWAGVPSTIMTELFPDVTTFDDEHLQKGTDQFIKEIDEMIWAFEADEYSDDCWDIDPGCKLGSGKLNMNKLEIHAKRKQDGIDLFAKRFQNLWW